MPAPRMKGEAVVIALAGAARQLGYLVYHANKAQGSEPGFYDLRIVGYGRAWCVECKSRGERLQAPRVAPRSGRLLPGQADWLLAEAAAGGNVCICRDGGGGENPYGIPERSYTEMLTILNCARTAWLEADEASLKRIRQALAKLEGLAISAQRDPIAGEPNPFGG